MPSPSLLVTVDLILRGGVCMLLALVAAQLLRDHGRQAQGRLGAIFAAGAAVYAVCSAAGLHRMLGVWAAPVMAISAGNNVAFWLFARSLFDDDFRPRAWHAALWALMAGLGLLDGLELAAGVPGEPVLGLGLSLASAGFAALAALQTIASWPGDLVESRRRLRVFIVAAASGYSLLAAVANALAARTPASAAVNLIEAVALAAIALGVAWALLGVNGGDALFGPAESTARREASAPDLGATDAAAVAALEHALGFDRIYRQERLTVAELAGRLGLPEYRLRRLINQGLGQRNFNAFLNSYRIADAKGALIDPAQDAVPVLTIALDAGFSSLGPFNRAFKTATGMTPTDYRRARGRGGLADSEIGQRGSDSARALANSA